MWIDSVPLFRSSKYGSTKEFARSIPEKYEGWCCAHSLFVVSPACLILSRTKKENICAKASKDTKPNAELILVLEVWSVESTVWRDTQQPAVSQNCECFAYLPLRILYYMLYKRSHFQSKCFRRFAFLACAY